MKALVPALILQPLVENAVRHGIEPRRGPGLISIEAKQEDKHLHLIVRDNGRGLPGADLNSSVRRGIGVANTEARLQGLYGQDQSFSFGGLNPKVAESIFTSLAFGTSAGPHHFERRNRMKIRALIVDDEQLARQRVLLAIG